MKQATGTYKILYDREVLEELQEVLEHAGIPATVEKDAVKFDPAYAFNPLQTEYRLILPLKDFERARSVIIQHYRYLSPQIPADYYLREFSNRELQEVLAKQDEWGEFDQAMAARLLEERDVEVNPSVMEIKKSLHLETKYQEQAVKAEMLFIYYVAGIALPPYGWVMGWLLGFSNNQLPDGSRRFAYNSGARMHGRMILLLSILTAVAELLYIILRSSPAGH